MHVESHPERFVWKSGPATWFLVIGAAVLFGIIFYPGLKEMLRVWDTREEYSYGYLIPFITAFLIWQKKHILEQTEFTGSWIGVAVTVAGLGIFYLGSLSTITTLVQYALLIVIIGVALGIMGWRAFRPIFVPLLFLAFMIPLPSFFLNNLSAQLQLLSSQLGVGVARAFNVSVYLEGNVIDLGVYKLQVVDACSGLRYLFPLMSLAFICAYIFQGALWKRAIIFLSSIPITVLMNSFRIGVISVLVEYWGVSQAEGFLHYFEGWVVFMACLGIILIEIWILAKVGKQKLAFHDAFMVARPEPTPTDAERRLRVLPRKQYTVIGILVVATAILSMFLTTRPEIRPQRADFDTFPVQLGEWQGQRDYLEKIYLDQLKLDDYSLINFVDGKQDFVNLYVAYYSSQRAGESAHSPRSCIPGGGWQIKQMSPYTVEGVMVNNVPLHVNRLVIQKGDNKQLVYYWFQQRGRVITNEYAVKWYLMVDAIRRNRTDGSLVRLTTVLRPGENIPDGDRRLTSFAALAVPQLHAYIPN